MLELSPKSNLLEQDTYNYSLQDVAEPNLYRDFYTYSDVPRVAFNHRRVPMGMPKDIWITDTSLRDGQQSVEPGEPHPDAAYQLVARHPEFETVTATVNIFPGIKTVQPVQLQLREE